MKVRVNRERVHSPYSDEYLAERILPHGVDRDRVVEVVVDEYYKFQFGPEGSYTIERDGKQLKYFVSFPGGFRHSGRIR